MYNVLFGINFFSYLIACGCGYFCGCGSQRKHKPMKSKQVDMRCASFDLIVYKKIK